jgi:beta-glucosidase
MAKKTSKSKKIAFRTGMGAIILVLATALIVGNKLALDTYSVSIDNLFTKTQEGDETITTDHDDWNSLAKDIEGEGAVLLKNTDNILPLVTSSTASKKVNLLGYSSYNPVYNGTGSGGTSGDTVISLVQGLTDAGYTINPAVAESNIYETIVHESNGFFGADLSKDETAITEYTGDVSFDNLDSYSDTAVIQISRAGGEGNDLSSYESVEGDTDEDDYLVLNKNEEDLLQSASDTFENIIVLLNTGNAMEIDWLDTYNIDAAVWVGQPGELGFESVGKILSGEINPSGRLVDTWAYDSKSAPSYQNFGDYSYDNVTYNDDGDAAHYVNYAEDIYVGYKWYETADVSGYFENQGTTYNDVVQYPFGYGESYTTFTQTIVGGTSDNSNIQKDDEITLEIEIENTGSIAGKDVAQVYYTAPYTEGGIEKSAVNLVAFAKTNTIEPGETETVELIFNVEDMASYDATANDGNGSYVLDNGTYNVSLRTNSHTEIDSLSLDLSNYVEFSDTEDGARSTDEVTATNQFQNSEKDSELNFLSRENGFANYTEIMSQDTSTANTTVKEQVENPGDYDESLDTIVTEEYVEGVDYRANGDYVASEGDLVMSDLEGKSYDDADWDKLLSQMSIEDMTLLISKGGWSTAEIESVGKPSTVDIDGPQGLNNFFDPIDDATSYPSELMLAATFNVDLSTEYGTYIADEAHDNGVTTWYAPAMNIHRSPYSGRNFEYYSEDGLLSGKMGASTILAARSKGLICTMKHFALNDQETNRTDALCTWATEQSIREIYLKPFELSVKEGHANAAMSSFNYIGGIWSGNHVGLMTNFLRDECGFQGFVITDATGGTLDGQPNAGIRAGNDLWLGMSSEIGLTIETNADIYYAKRSCKNILFAQANATVIASTVTNWKPILYTIDAVFGAGILVAGYFLTRSFLKASKEKKEEK